MTDSSSFSSLLALVDSHLSKTSVQESRSEDGNSVRNRFPIPSLDDIQSSVFSDTRLSCSPGQRAPLPSVKLGDSPIQSILAEQVANMLKAKELKRLQEEEKRKLEEQMSKIRLEEQETVIDLMQALQTPCPQPRVKEEVLSSSSSFESLFEPKFIECDAMPELSKTPEPLLPCKTDMSSILHKKVRKGKCSPFGKVLTSRLKPVAAPYMRLNIQSDIVRFQFDTQSPCDIIKAKLRKPTCYVAYQPDVLSFIM